ncbi:MAG TPA: squalene/phytoene synthase family protein, partial [Asticcacaulis sp.]|nr:squalene/phytoene synthase family protein [Asticcacaulis sp.]
MTSSELLPKSEDVRLACAFIPDAEKRAEILALFAFLETLRDIPERTTDALMGEIRLRWWYEAIEEIEQKRPVRYHPLTQALKVMIERYDLPPKDFLDLIEGQ